MEHGIRWEAKQAVTAASFRNASEMRGYQLALKRFAGRWRDSCNLGGSPCQLDLKSYLEDIPGLSDLGCGVDPVAQNLVLYRYSDRGSLELDTALISRLLAQVRARTPAKPSLGIYSVNRETLLAVILPPASSSPPLVACFREQALLNQMLRGYLRAGNPIRVTIGGQEIFRRESARLALGTRWGRPAGCGTLRRALDIPDGATPGRGLPGPVPCGLNPDSAAS